MNKRLSLIAALCAAALLGSAGLAVAEPPRHSDRVRLNNTAARAQGPVTRVAVSGDYLPPADVLGSRPAA